MKSKSFPIRISKKLEEELKLIRKEINLDISYPKLTDIAADRLRAFRLNKNSLIKKKKKGDGYFTWGDEWGL